MTHYDVLGVAPEAHTDELRRAYVALARRHHPDHGGDHATMRAINQAWAVLGDPGKRAAYDAGLTGAGPSAPGPGGRSRGTFEGGDDPDLYDQDDRGLDDDRPLTAAAPPRWLAMVPAAVFAAAVVAFAAGLVFNGRPLVVGAFVLFVAACAMFVLTPFVVLAGATLLRRRSRAGVDGAAGPPR